MKLIFLEIDTHFVEVSLFEFTNCSELFQLNSAESVRETCDVNWTKHNDRMKVVE